MLPNDDVAPRSGIEDGPRAVGHVQTAAEHAVAWRGGPPRVCPSDGGRPESLQNPVR